LIYSQLLEKKSINKLEDWFRYTEIPEILNVKNVTTKELYESLSDISNEELDQINERMNQVFKKYDDELDAAVIDVTDTYFEGDNEEVQRRKGKDGKIKKLLQIGLGASFKSGFPLFYKKYQGNLSNIQIYKDMALELKARGMNSVIVDRGMTSYENIKMSLELDVKIIAGLKKNKSLCSEFLSKINRDEIYSLKNMVKLKNTDVHIKTFDYNEGKLIAVYNPSLEVIKKQLMFNRGIDEIDPYIGYSLIYHNTKYLSEEVVKRYYDKEIIERAFKQIKGILNLRPIRVWLKQHVEGHIAICYLAYAILSLMDHKLKKINMSAIEAITSLKYGYKINLQTKKDNQNWDLYIPLQPKQKNILKEIGVVFKN